MATPTTQPVLEQIAPKATYYAAGVTAGVGAWTLQDWLIIVSILSIAATYFTNLYFKMRDDQRKQEKHDEDMGE